MNNLKDIHNGFTFAGQQYCVVLSGFQWTIWRIYTTQIGIVIHFPALFYQDFNEQFEGYTQHIIVVLVQGRCCFIRISMNNLKDIHNLSDLCIVVCIVVLSGFQWTIWRIYTTVAHGWESARRLFYQDFKDTFVCNTQLYTWVILYSS